ncbi:LOW QUALITY PROTEIN: hypothetical protein Cgig2_021098 [Carnegiea gigantea]|uniref:Uncharacterized protein n=1 Tax=Carnegiea gigantea TaxID=171969 RepID=A0A9Q1QC50_9CARY|nr:LOW QUALITY PROTEIN: hypothetical protein Cgig2_021098 [Carnegiea gigantea]
MSTSHTSKGEVSLSIFDIHNFLKLSLSGRLYDEVFPTQRELNNKEIEPLTQEYYPLLLTQELVGGVIFNELGVAKGQRTETFLTAFLSCYYAHSSCQLEMVAYALTFITLHHSWHWVILPSYEILMSIYKGLNEISRSSHFGRAKNFNTYKLDAEASSSPGMAKYSGLGHAKSSQLEEARRLISSGRGFG